MNTQMQIHISRVNGGNLTVDIDGDATVTMPEDDIHSAMQWLRERYPNHEITVSEEVSEEL